jgi:hypothetical protein
MKHLLRMRAVPGRGVCDTTVRQPALVAMAEKFFATERLYSEE